VAGDVLVYAYASEHDTSEPLNYIIDFSENERLCYSIDTRTILQKLDGITHFLTECNYSHDCLEKAIENGVTSVFNAERIRKYHKSLESLLQELSRMDLQKLQEIWLLHISDRNSDEKLFKETIQKQTGCIVFVA
jgi:hypothetical protein